MSKITFTSIPFSIGSWTIIRIPGQAGGKLPSRGANAVAGTINGVPFQTVLEPDGKGSHWFSVDEKLCERAGINVAAAVKLSIAPSETWPEPDVPADVKDALASIPAINSIWNTLTPLARWDWIRWIRATADPATRGRRIEKACSMLEAGKRRPCCFNRNLCTETAVAKNGVLLEE